MPYQASPKFMAPRHNGETLTAAVGARRRCRPRRVLGGGGSGNAMVESFPKRFSAVIYAGCLCQVLD